MNSPRFPESTTFSRDFAGRYACNTLDEALASHDTAIHPDNRPFDAIIIGGGSFGAALASHLFHTDKRRSRRILVLDAGPLGLLEHWQNLPASIEIPQAPGPGSVWENQVWNSDSSQTWNQRFPGLAYCVGGRSVFWGGWSPYFIDSEVDPAFWPASVRQDLMTPVLDDGGGKKISYLEWAGRQIGTDATNDFIFGPLQVGLRKKLFDGLNARSAAAPTKLTGNRGTLTKVEDLEAPLAVQSASPSAGNFPFNKFNGVQLLLRAARAAQIEAEAVAPITGTQAESIAAIARKKRLMLCPNTRIVRLEYDGQRIARVITNQFGQEVAITVPPQGQVFLALGTVENTRQALLSLPNSNGQIGRNLMAHLRSNLTIRVSRATFRAFLEQLRLSDPGSFPTDLDEALQANALGTSALFVKGIVQVRSDLKGHFHIQITGSGLGGLGLNSEAELFKKIPDIEDLDTLRHADDQWIVLTLRGIGEMFGDRVPVPTQNRITLDPSGPRGYFDYGQPRALVALEAGAVNAEHDTLWQAMDNASLEVAQIFGAGGEVQYLHPPQGATPQKALWKTTPPVVNARRDTLSSTHHEGGTLRMGSSPVTSATDEWGRLWETTNLFAVGPALLPTLGSPNPMLSGVALAFRLADHLLATTPYSAADSRALIQGPPLDEIGFRPLFDGTAKTFNNWVPVGENRFALIDGCIVTQDGGDIGLLFHSTARLEREFSLRLDFKLSRPTGDGNDNSGVFIRFQDPRQPVLDRNGVDLGQYGNGAYVAVDTGFEIQIDEMARGNVTKGEPDGMDKKRTGAFYDIPTDPSSPYFQVYQQGPALQAGVWHTMEISTGALAADADQAYKVKINGREISSYQNLDTYRGKPGSIDAVTQRSSTSGCFGVQAHSGRVAFRNIRLKTPVQVPVAIQPVARTMPVNSVPQIIELPTRVRTATAISAAKSTNR